MANISEKNIALSSLAEEIKSIEKSNAEYDFLSLCKDYRGDDLLKLIVTCIEQGADINKTNTNQKNAIQLLCENYNVKDFMQIIACIIQNGFDIKKHNSSVLRSVLDSSMDKSQQDEVLRLLTRYGLNCYSPSTNLRKLRNKDGSIRIGFIDYLVETRKTLGWHEGCQNCQEILSIGEVGRRNAQNYFMFENVYTSFVMLQLAQKTARSRRSDVPIKEWNIEEEEKLILYRIQKELKDGSDTNGLNCSNYELYLRTMCSVAKSLNHEAVVDVIRWFYLLPFDFPIRSCKLSSSDQEILKEWDKTLEKFSHDENDQDYGELIKYFAHNKGLRGTALSMVDMHVKEVNN